MVKKDKIFIFEAPPGWLSQTRVTTLLNLLRSHRILKKTVALNISFVSDGKMIALNTHFRKKRRVTDVLSFENPVFHQDPMNYLGDLVFCKSVIKKQAEGEDHSPRQEVLILLIHGLLHLLGYDHEKSAKESQKMSRLEKKILDLFLKKNSSKGLIERTVFN